MIPIPDDVLAAATLPDALSRILVHFGADSGTIHILDADGLLHLRAASEGIPAFVLQEITVILVGKGMAGLAVQRAEPVTACNIQTDNTGDVRPGARATGLEGALVVPMMKNGEPVGALGIANRAERTFTPEEISLLTAIGEYLAARHG